MRKTLLPIILIILVGCKPCKTDLTKSEMLEIVTKCDKHFSIGIKNRDSAYLANIYSDSAQYITPQRPILKGKVEIAKDWGGFLRLKEKPIDLVLNISNVGGNREIIYETGNGYTLLADSTKWTFNYVNVWRLQKDGSYKLEIDTYN